MAPHAREMWNFGAFALKPIWLSEDKKTLRLQFFWQRSVHFAPGSVVKLTTLPHSSEGLDGASRELFLHARKGQLTSGDVIEMTTTDPEGMPLPSWRLLEMQWALQRVTGMAGGAEPLDLEDEDEDSDVPDLILEGIDYTMSDPQQQPSSEKIRRSKSGPKRPGSWRRGEDQYSRHPRDCG